MNESTLTNLDGIPQYTSVDTHHYHTNNVDNNSMTIIVQNPFDDSSNTNKYHSTDNPLSQHPVRFNQELLDNFGINIPMTKQTGTTELIPIPSSLNPYTTSAYNQQTMSNGIYTRPFIQTRPTNGNSPMILRYPNQQYGQQMMKPRMTYGQVIMPQHYDPNSIYRTNHLPPDNNILKSLLQINPEVQPQMNVNQQPKSRKKRKGNEINTSTEDDIPAKSRKRKKKGAEETEKFVEYSLQQLRDLPMLTPIEPIIDVKNDLILNFSTKKSKYQGEFGDVFIENIPDYYRSYRRRPLIVQSNSLSERHFRLCSNILDQPPSLPSSPLMINSSEKLIELTNDIHDDDDESIISASTDNEDDDNLINNIQTDHNYLLKTLSASCDQDLCPLSPVFIAQDELEKHDQPIAEGTDKVSVTLTLTTEAANNVQSVIAAVTDLLKIAYPSTIDIHQSLNDNNNNCTCSKDLLSLSSNTQITNLNRSSSIYKTGRETNTNIQTLIDTQPKTCRNCLQNLTIDTFFKKRLNELPVHLRELTPNSEPFIYFCHEQCFNTYIIKPEPMDHTTTTTTLTKNVSIKRQIKTIKQWKRWDPSLLVPINDQQSDTNEIHQLIEDIKIPIPSNAKEDKRICVFCNGIGDMTNDGPGRLLNLNVGIWCHLNCALWSSEVYETKSGSLMSVEQAYLRSLNTTCVICDKKGSSLSCFYQRCSNTYHFTCAINNHCVFYKNKTIMCPIHALKTITNDEILDDKSVLRKVWINRDEIKQIQNYMNDEHDDKSYILRIGSLILHNIGQLLPHQLQSSAFNNRNFIYPVGYKITRFYWSMCQPNRRCAYICSIIDIDNKPMFRIFVENEEFIESTPKNVWHKVVNKIDLLRKEHGLVKMFPVFVTGEDLFGLTEPHITRLIESLPGVEMLQNYAFKYGRLQLFEMPLTVNPTGCARSEPKLRTHFRRHAQALTSSHSARSALPRTAPGVENTQISYVKQFVLSKPTQYRKLKTEWRQNTYLAKSRIQGLGLFAARDLEKHTMVIEYIGELIRNEVANKREKLYEQQNRGIYMFRLDDDYVVDATMSGCLARYVNHSCDPNSIAEVVQIEKENKIIIITNRRIAKGEELMYDYKFDFEEDSKIPCLCGAANCRNWMN